MEHFSRATEEELDRRGEAKHFLYELQQDFFFDDGETLFPKKKDIYILSCDHAGRGRGTDDRLQHNESDQLQGAVVRSEGFCALTYLSSRHG